MPVALLLTIIAVSLPGEQQYLAGRDAERLNQFADAQKQYLACVEHEGPLRPYGLARAVLCLAQAGEGEAAAAAFERLSQAYPKGPWIRMTEAGLAMAHHSRKQHIEAAPLFEHALDLSLLPWWFNEIQWAAADNFLAIPDRACDGYAILQTIADSTSYRKRRLDAARILAASPNPDHRLAAAAAMVRSADYKAAAQALAWLQPALLDHEERQARWQYLKARTLLVSGEPHKGRSLFENVATNYPESPWAPFALNRLARSLFSAKQTEQADAIFTRLFERYPGSEAAGDALWWRARAHADKKDHEAAVADYLLLSRQCPAHAYADDALLAAGELLDRIDEPKRAVDILAQFPECLPGSPLIAEAMYRSARFRQSLDDVPGAIADLRKGAQGPVGDFYTHRALELLGQLAKDDASVGPSLHVNPPDSFLRPAVLTIPEPAEPPPEEWPDTPWYRRLGFFGSHGLEESEWEALYIAEACKLASTTERDAQAGALYQALADAGLAHTAARLVYASKWRLEGGTPSLQRLRVLYPRPYWESVCAIAKETHLDPYLLLAVGRQESTFRARIRSWAGAVGVMQLMPTTADWLAKVEPSISPEHLANLEHPDNSLRFGAYYLMRMIDRSDANLVYALASYNAGPGNVDKWRRRTPTKDMEVFVDRIPFTETKGFVKRVLGNYAAYHSLYTQPHETETVVP